MPYAFGKGSTFAVTTAGSTTFVTVAQVVSGTPPTREYGEVDVTVLGSVVGETRPTIARASQAELVLEYDPEAASHASLITQVQSTGTLHTCRVTLNGSTGTTRMEFDYFMKAWAPQELTVDGVQLVNATLRCTSNVTFTFTS